MLSKLVCFVCGSQGACHSLHSKAREKGAYFPFLETHDPPKGARLATSEGTVDSCRVCYSFLNQQWDSFEASKTPAMKRLYWLKRTDNGTFTGAEMKLQGEYAAQMMGLQYHPTGTGTMSPYEYAAPSTAKPSSSRATGNVPKTPSPSPSRPMSAASTSRPPDNFDGALDLSFGSGEKKPKKEQPGNRAAVKPKMEPMDTSSFTCFLCGGDQSITLARFIFAQKYTEDEPYYPFLTRIPIPPGVTMSASRGYQVCRTCKNTLYTRWQQYKLEATPESLQVYVINNNVVSGNGYSRDKQVANEDEACYLCGQFYQRGSMKQLNTRRPAESSKYSMYFPFILSLKCPKSARPVDIEGRVFSCRACYSYLQRQWQTYQNDSIPMDRRHFLLRPLTDIGKETKSSSSTPIKDDKNEEESVAQPLNIRVSSAPGGAASTQAGTSSYLNSSLMPGLLAIAPNLSPQVMLSSMYGQGLGYYPGYASTSATDPNKSPGKSRGDEQVKRPSSNGASGKSSPGKARDPYKQSMISRRTSDTVDAEHCFICGSRCGGKICKLRAHPTHPDTVDNRNVPSDPFFPFVANQEPAPKARRLSESGSANTCRFCFFHLLNQWKEYEKSAHPTDMNRWLRKYNYKIYVCYTCGILTPRSDVKTLNTKKFSTLPLTPKPSMGVQMEDDGSVVVCRGCRDDLQRQYDTFDKQGVPVPMRQFIIQNKGTRSIGYYVDEEGISSASSASIKASPGAARGAGGDTAANATRQASFAAALRKLAKQAEGPDSSSGHHPPHENHHHHHHRPSSPHAAATREPAKHRGVVAPAGHPVPAAGVNQHHPGTSASSPPSAALVSSSAAAATNAALHNHYAHSTAGNDTKPSDLRTSAVGSVSSAAVAAGLMVDTIKQEHHGKVTPSSSHDPHRPESRPHSSNSSARITPQLAMSSVPLPSSSTITASQAGNTYDTLTTSTTSAAAQAAISRGFQPYRASASTPGAADDPLLRAASSTSSAGVAYHPFAAAAAAAAAASVDPMAYSAAAAYQHALAAAAAASSSAAAAQNPFAQHGFRMDDPLLMERYRFLQHPLSGMSAGYPHPSLLAAVAGNPGYMPPGMRYPGGGGAAELLAQHFAYLPPGTKLPDHMSPSAVAAAADRAKTEEDIRREREKEAEKEREERARREKEEREKREKEERLRREQRAERDRREREKQEREKQLREAERRSPARAEDLSVGRHRGSDFSTERLLSSSHFNGKDPLRHLDNEKRDKNILLHQFLQEQDYLLRERGLIGYPPPAAPPIVSSSAAVAAGHYDQPRDFSTKSASLSVPRVTSSASAVAGSTGSSAAVLTSSSSGHQQQQQQQQHHQQQQQHPGFHRPFELGNSSAVANSKTEPERQQPQPQHPPPPAPLTNGYDKYADYERRLLLEQERAAASQEHKAINHHHHSQSQALIPRLDKQYLEYHNRQIDDRKPEGIQARLIDAAPPTTTTTAATTTPTKQQQRYHHHPHHPQQHQDSTRGLHNQQQQQHQNNAAISSQKDHTKSEPQDTLNNPVVSKLDIVEKQIHEARQNGTLDSDDSDIEDIIGQEETKLQRLLLISDGPPMAMNKSPQKLQYLQQFGLTTQDVKKEVEFAKQCKRRRMYREPSVSPVELSTSPQGEEHGGELRVQEPTPLQYPPPHLHPDELNREPHYKQKARFLFSMGLEPVPPERRRQLEHIRKVCDWDRQRRNGVIADKHVADNFILSQPADSNPLKRKHPDSHPNNLHPHYSKNAPSVHPQAATTTNSMTPTTTTTTIKSAEKNTISLKLVIQKETATTTPTNSAAATGSQDATKVANGPKPVSSGSGGSGAMASAVPPTQPVPRAVIFPEAATRGHHMVLPASVSRSFAQEFHKSVLQTTRQQQESKAKQKAALENTSSAHSSTSSHPPPRAPAALVPSMDNTTSHPPPHHSVPSSSSTVPVSLPKTTPAAAPAAPVSAPSSLASPGGSVDSSSWVHGAVAAAGGVQHGWRWPGVETVMEGYARYADELRLERQVLQEQGAILAQENRKLNGTAEMISMHMADLMRTKQRQEQERRRTQSSLDHLKNIMRTLHR